jgi:hypothetical protein
MTSVYTATVTPPNTDTIIFKEKVSPFVGAVVGSIPAVAGVAVLNKLWLNTDYSTTTSSIHILQAFDGATGSNLSTPVTVVLPGTVTSDWSFTDPYDGLEVSSATWGTITIHKITDNSTTKRWSAPTGSPQIWFLGPPWKTRTVFPFETYTWGLTFDLIAHLVGGVWQIYYTLRITYVVVHVLGGGGWDFSYSGAFGVLEYDASPTQSPFNPTGAYARGNAFGLDTGVGSLLSNMTVGSPVE